MQRPKSVSIDGSLDDLDTWTDILHMVNDRKRSSNERRISDGMCVRVEGVEFMVYRGDTLEKVKVRLAVVDKEIQGDRRQEIRRESDIDPSFDRRKEDRRNEPPDSG